MVMREDGQQQNSLSAEAHSELFSQLNDGTVLRFQVAVCLHILLLRYEGFNKIHISFDIHVSLAPLNSDKVLDSSYLLT
jgi:hypothetical protein